MAKRKLPLLMNRYISPSFQLEVFTCPHCGAITQQKWIDIYQIDDTGNELEEIGDVSISVCQNPDCRKRSVWYKRKLVFPLSSVAPLPYDDMPSDVKEDFLEARDVVGTSPRSAAALLRLALQKLMKHLGQKGEDINEDIGKLVKIGLSPTVQEALDSLRIYGNSAVHPGEIGLKDDRETALKLFNLLNIIVYHLIIHPKETKELYNRLPPSKVDYIKKRDNKVTQ